MPVRVKRQSAVDAGDVEEALNQALNVEIR